MKQQPKVTAAQLRAAAERVIQNEIGQRAAARSLNISTDKLRREMERGQMERRGVAVAVQVQGKATALHPEVEAELAENIRVMCRAGFPRPPPPPLLANIPEFVQAWIKMDVPGRSVLAWEERGHLPGSEWAGSFMKRNKLSLKRSGAMERKRKTANEDPFLIYDYYDKLETVINDLGLQDRPDRIFNTDETCFCHDPDKMAVVGIRGEKTERVRGGPGRNNTTVLATTCADGTALDPMINSPVKGCKRSGGERT